MGIQTSIESKLNRELSPQLLLVQNESHMHGGSALESHFNLTVVSDQFADLSRVQRHQCVYRLLAEEMQGELHALALHLYTPQEWDESTQQTPSSPDCRGR